MKLLAGLTMLVATVPLWRCGAAEPTAALPERLSATGLFRDIATGELEPGVLPFTPQYPLWTDGARKRRWIRLPPGANIDARDPNAFEFPIGTRLWKEFAFERPIETRVSERLADGSWRHVAYVWTADGSDALLAPEAGVRGAAESSPGVRYDVPGRADCRACHATGAGAVLGFSALQLSTDRDPLAPHAEVPQPGSVDLAGLRARGLISPPLADDAPRIDARTPRERAVLGYLHGNCGMCHHPRADLAALGMVLASTPGGVVPAAIDTTVGHAAAHSAGAVRIRAGRPDASLLVQRLASTSPLLRMPPLGTRQPDAAAISLIRAWIECDLAPGAELSKTENCKE